MLSSRKAWSLPTWAGRTWISLQLTSCKGRQRVGKGIALAATHRHTHTHTHTIKSIHTLTHQFHQLFGLADLLWDGHELVVAHKQNFEGEAEQVFRQNGQEVSTAEQDKTSTCFKNCSQKHVTVSLWCLGVEFQQKGKCFSPCSCTERGTSGSSQTQN